MKVPITDLKKQTKHLLPALYRAFDQILTEADFIMGAPVHKFEQEFARFCGKRYCVGLNSGTDALTLALKAYGVGKGHEVITVTNSFFSTAMAISNVGATPVFVDCDETSHTIHASQIEQKITPRTKAIIPVHLYGQAADMDPILELAKKHNLHVIEDCCQAHGARYKGKVVPIGETGAFSFYPTKNLGAYGDAGALVTNNRNVYQYMTYAHNNGSPKKYVHTVLGINSRMDSLQAAVLLLKLKHLPRYTQKRRAIASRYNKYLRHIRQIQIPREMPYAHHVYHLYVIECEKRNQLADYLKKKGIQTSIVYPSGLHLQRPYIQLGYKRGDFPITERKNKSVLSLPMFPELTGKEITYVCKTIKDFYLRFS